MGKDQLSLLKVEPFADALFGLWAIYSTCHHLAQPASLSTLPVPVPDLVGTWRTPEPEVPTPTDTPSVVLWARTSGVELQGAASIPVQLACLHVLVAHVPPAQVVEHVLEGCSVANGSPAIALVGSLPAGSILLATSIDRLVRRVADLQELITTAALHRVLVVVAHASLGMAQVLAQGPGPGPCIAPEDAD